MNDIVIIGGGASGLMLAASCDLTAMKKADGSSPRGILLEKTHRAGTKLLLSGGGRCNITHGGPVRDLVSAYGSAGSFLRRSLNRHSNIELAGWLEDRGIALADERGRPVASEDLRDPASACVRVFPASMKASEILDAFLTEARHNGWEIRTESGVYGIESADAQRGRADTCGMDGCGQAQPGGGRWLVKASPADTYLTDRLVIAAGGITFPETGSDGSLFDTLRELGIKITEQRPALAPVYVKDYPYEELSGISLPEVTASVHEDGGSEARRIISMSGSLLFTHEGFSGPVILNISRYAVPGSILRLSYGRSFDELPRRMQRVLERRASGPSGDVRTTVLAALTDADSFTVEHTGENGMVTAGGICLDEIDNMSMELKRYKGMYAAGEAVDADGITGGYNLQMCWSTARTAADSVREDIQADKHV